MNLDAMISTATQLVEPGRGLLAADESVGAIGRRLAAIHLANTEANRRDYRELLLSADDAMGHISGVILHDETIWQKSASETPMVTLIERAGAQAGIKADEGARALHGAKGDLVTKGLDGLDRRLPRYYELGASFAKWRAIINPSGGRPTHAGVLANAHALARFANLCQEVDIVPVIEPEVLADGDNDIDVTYAVTEWLLKEVFQQLYYMRVKLEGVILMPAMIVPGAHAARQASLYEVAEKTVACLKAGAPSALAGVAFISGGQPDALAIARLDAINRLGGAPWPMTFAFGRALQTAALQVWAGRAENVAAAQAEFAHRARMSALASRGQWDKKLDIRPAPVPS